MVAPVSHDRPYQVTDVNDFYGTLAEVAHWTLFIMILLEYNCYNYSYYNWYVSSRLYYNILIHNLFSIYQYWDLSGVYLPHTPQVWGNEPTIGFTNGKSRSKWQTGKIIELIPGVSASHSIGQYYIYIICTHSIYIYTYLYYIYMYYIYYIYSIYIVIYCIYIYIYIR